MKIVPIKPYVSAHKNCTLYHSSARLNESNSYVAFSMNDLSNNYRLEIKREKGASVNIIINGTTHILNTTASTYIDILSQEIEIKRPTNSLGKIIISQILVEDSEKSSEFQSVKPDTYGSSTNDVIVMHQTWEEFEKNHKNLKGIKKTNSGVFAAEYAEIRNSEDITDIETDIPNSWIRKKDKIVFIYPCKIFGMYVNGKNNKQDTSKNSILEKINKTVQSPDIIVKEPKMIKTVVFDSNNYNGIGSVSNRVIGSVINGKDINMGRTGRFKVPLSAVRPNVRYEILITADKLNGNGKISVQLDNNGTVVYNSGTLVLNRKDQTLKLPIEIKRSIVSGSFSLLVFRPTHISTGNILVKRLLITAMHSEYDLQPSVTNSKLTQTTVTSNLKIEPTFDDIIPECISTPINSSEPITNWYNYEDIAIDRNIRELFGYFSILQPDSSVVKNKLNITGSIEITDFNSKLWYNYVRNSFTDLKYSFSNKLCFHGENPTAQSANLTICSIYSLKPSKRIFLKETPNGHIFTQLQKDILFRCKEIFTTSLIDYLKIKKELPKANVKVSFLPFPYIDGEYEQKDHYVYFEEEQTFTDSIASIWPQYDHMLYVIGSNSILKGKAKHIPYTYNYSEIFKYIKESKGLIYLSKNTNHKSGLLELAYDLGKPVLTNNISMMNTATIIRYDSEKMIDPADLRNKLPGYFEKKSSDGLNMNSYNEKVENHMRIILGVK